MDLKIIKKRLEEKIAEIEEIIQEMPNKGDTCFSSQKICLKNAINDFSYAVNGIKQKDLEQ